MTTKQYYPVLGKDYNELFIGNLFTHGVICFINNCSFHKKWISIADMDDSISLEKCIETSLRYFYTNYFNHLNNLLANRLKLL